MTALTPAQEQRIAAKIDQVKREFGADIYGLLKEQNDLRLKGKGKLNQEPVMDRHSLRWTLAWRGENVSYEMNIIVRLEDDGQEAHVAQVWVHRHASTPVEFEGHTPTTRMHRLSGLDLTDIRNAIEVEWFGGESKHGGQIFTKR